MANKKSKRNQKLYKMSGCSKKTRKIHLGGSPDAHLVYTGKPIFSVPNSNLAYTGKGGNNININAANPEYPNTGPIPKNNTIFNSAMPQHGGNCPSCNTFLMNGGGCGCSLLNMKGGKKKLKKTKKNNSMTGFMVGGIRHRPDCKCSECKKLKNVTNMSGGNNKNTYPNDLVGSNNSFLDMKAGKGKQRGGTLSNFIGQDFINLGRQFQFGLGSAYNALAGYSSPINPLPWKDQFPVGAPMNPVKPIV